MEAQKATIIMKDIYGPVAIRIAREATPVVTKQETIFKFGKANVIRYRGKSLNFIDSFETILADDYISEEENISIIACGPVLAEAMRAAYILKEEYAIEARVINIHTVKPIDKRAIIRAMKETRFLVTCEEHQAGGFGNIVAGVASENKDINDEYLLKMIGIRDKFGCSGQPWELMKIFGLTAEFIVKDICKFIKINDSILSKLKY